MGRTSDVATSEMGSSLNVTSGEGGEDDGFDGAPETAAGLSREYGACGEDYEEEEG